MAPWNKEVGPLGKAQKEGDLLKKKVDQIVKESNKVISQKATGNQVAEKQKKLEQMYQNCLDSKTLVAQHLAEVENLEEKNEAGKMKDFEKKKSAELNRVTVMKTLLEETMLKLLPNTNEKEFIKSHESPEQKEKNEKKDASDKEKLETQAKAESGDEEDEDDEEEEEEDEEDEDDEEEEEEEDDEDIGIEAVKAKQSVKPAAAKVVQKEESEEEEEEEEEDDDEEEEEEEQTEKSKSAVKSAVSKPKPKEEKEEEDDDEEDDDDDDEEEDDDEDEEEDDDDDEETKTRKVRRFMAVEDFEGEEDGDLSFKENEVLEILDMSRGDGWWEAKNKNGQKGMVPSTYLQEVPVESDQEPAAEKEELSGEDEVDQGSQPRTKKGRKLWKGLKQALNETTVSDVLHALGAVPSGFRLSTLCRKFNEGSYTYRMINYLFPKLSHSNLTYRDLVFNPAVNKIYSMSPKINRVVTIMSCQQIPPPGAGIDVLNRHVRMCLFDGQHILSNIHAVTVASVDKSQRTWSFTTKVSDLMDPASHAEFFVRSNTDNIGILFELGVSYLRSSTQEKGEFSCGWILLPLTEEINKSYDLQLNGGTPYEKDVEVDPSISRRATSNTLVALISGNKQPRIIVKVTEPKKQHKDLMDMLPDTLVGNTCLLQQYAYYRQCLADVLLRDRVDLNSTELISSPFLNLFPLVADCPDLMRTLRTAWHEKLQGVKREEKPIFSIGSNPLRDEEYMKQLFKQVFMDTVYPIFTLNTMPNYIMGDEEILTQRQEEINRFMERKRLNKSALAALLSEDFSYSPFYLEETSFNILEPYGLGKQQVAA